MPALTQLTDSLNATPYTEPEQLTEHQTTHQTAVRVSGQGELSREVLSGMSSTSLSHIARQTHGAARLVSNPGLRKTHSLLPRKTKSQFMGPYVISHVVIRYSCPAWVTPPPWICFDFGLGSTMQPGALMYVVRFGSAKLHTGVPLRRGHRCSVGSARNQMTVRHCH